MISRALLLATVALAPVPALSATISFGGQQYLDPYTALVAQSDYFLTNPTPVGQSLTLRFYDDYCVGRTAQVLANPDLYGPLNYCKLYSYTPKTDVNSFFTLALDGQQGPSATEQTYFFSLTFAPTSYVAPTSPLFDSFYNKTIYDDLITFSWDAYYGGNEADQTVFFEGAVVPPAPVPLPASGLMLVAGLAAAGVAGVRRRRT